MVVFYLSMLDSDEDKKTFSAIYEKLRLPCFHIALKITQNRELAEDAVHNAFLAVIRHKDKIFNLPCGKQRSLIVIITKNKSIDLMRMEKTRTHIPVDDMEDIIADGRFDVGKIYEDQKSYEALMDSISSLPEMYKTVFELRYVHELGNQEIAELLGITPKAVSMRISRAKTMLQEIINRGEI